MAEWFLCGVCLGAFACACIGRGKFRELNDENAKLRKHVREAIELAEAISITICREGREEEFHPADKSPIVAEWRRVVGG